MAHLCHGDPRARGAAGHAALIPPRQRWAQGSSPARCEALPRRGGGRHDRGMLRTEPLASARSLVGSAFADALSLLLPTWCAGCDEPGRALCASCLAQLSAQTPRRRSAPGLDIRSAVSFEGVAARAVRALKEDGRTGLARPLGRLVGRAVVDAGWEGGVLVPVPSSRAALRRRGYAVPELLARRSGLPVRRMLRTARIAADQRALGREDRARNVTGTLAGRAVEPGCAVVVVDDVVTTGATLREAQRVLEDAGARVLGAVTFADTPRLFSPEGRP